MESAEPTLSDREEFSLKTSGFWQGAYQGWFATALEQTKAVFTLASAGVGLSLTLLFNANVQPMDSWAPIWLLLAAVSFVAASVFGVAVFHVNKLVLGKLIGGKDCKEDEAFVGRLDAAARLGFGAGLLFLILAGVSQIWL
jgi:hypothetical protein